MIWKEIQMTEDHDMPKQTKRTYAHPCRKMEGFLKHTVLPGGRANAMDNGRYKHVQHKLEAAKLSVQKSMDCVSMLHSVGMSGNR